MKKDTYIILEPQELGFAYRYCKVIDDQGTLKGNFVCGNDGLYRNDTSPTAYKVLYTDIVMSTRAKRIKDSLNKIDLLEQYIDSLRNC